MAAVTPPTLRYIEAHAGPFPFHLLEECRTGLCLFSAGFHGANDAVHFAMSGVTTTCVDTDAEKILEMRRVYPPDWSFTVADAWTYAHAARELEVVWDAVCVDPHRGDAMVRSDASLDLWLSLAARVLIVGTQQFPFAPPASWRVRTFYTERIRGTYWLAMVRE